MMFIEIDLTQKERRLLLKARALKAVLENDWRDREDRKRLLLLYLRTLAEYGKAKGLVIRLQNLQVQFWWDDQWHGF